MFVPSTCTDNCFYLALFSSKWQRKRIRFVHRILPVTNHSKSVSLWKAFHDSFAIHSTPLIIFHKLQSLLDEPLEAQPVSFSLDCFILFRLSVVLKNSSIRIQKILFKYIQVFSVVPLLLVSVYDCICSFCSQHLVHNIVVKPGARNEMWLYVETAPELVMLSVSSCWSCALTHYAQYILPWLCWDSEGGQGFLW